MQKIGGKRWMERGKQLALAAMLTLSACLLGENLQIAPIPLFCALLGALTLGGAWLLRRRPLARKEMLTLGGFALLLSIVLILGQHISVDAMDLYGGTYQKNKILPYSWRDLCAVLVMLPSLTTLLGALYRLIANVKGTAFDPAPHWKRHFCLFGVLLLLWLPYLLAYWPGVILGDTLSSIRQALGITRLNNRHPFCYTIFLRICFRIGQALSDGNTLGYVLYTILQMLYVSFCLAYLLNWVWRHGRFGRIVAIVFTALFGLLPYFAAFSVAGWKDPVFSASVAALSVFLLHHSLHGNQKPSRLSRIIYAFLLFIMVFIRHNGIAIAAVVAMWQLAAWLIRRKPRGFAAVTAGVICLYLIITGPVYDYLDIWTDKREANALCIQQLARVAAVGGEMDAEEEAFLDGMLPMELYAEAYRPCCVDLLKWDEHFNSDAFSDDFYRHWFSLMLKNPRLYFEAWELNTFGFWTLNQPEINAKASNLKGGAIRNTLSSGVEEMHELGIEFANLLGDDRLREVFPLDSWFLPIGWTVWMLAFLCVCIALKGQKRLFCGLLPALGLTIPLVIGTPIAYWMRYIVALHYLLPVWLVILGLKKENSLPESSK